MDRRHLMLAAASTAIAALPPRRTGAAVAVDRTLCYVPAFTSPSLDPILGIPVRIHAYMVYDTLYGVDAALRPQPQMAAGHVVEEDGRRWTITLRDGLAFHDGEKVRAQDAVASIARWMKRNTFGQKLESVTDELSPQDVEPHLAIGLGVEQVLHRIAPSPLSGAPVWLQWLPRG